MWGRLGPRFAVEALFLVLVAVGLAFADVRPLIIVLVMAGAWLLVSLIELLAARGPRYAPVVEAPVEPVAAAPAAAVGVDTEPGVPPDVEPAPAVVESEADVVEPVAPRRGWLRLRRRREPETPNGGEQAAAEAEAASLGADVATPEAEHADASDEPAPTASRAETS